MTNHAKTNPPLAAGLDTRAFRLPWLAGTQPACERQAIPADLTR